MFWIRVVGCVLFNGALNIETPRSAETEECQIENIQNLR